MREICLDKLPDAWLIPVMRSVIELVTHIIFTLLKRCKSDGVKAPTDNALSQE